MNRGLIQIIVTAVLFIAVTGVIIMKATTNKSVVVNTVKEVVKSELDNDKADLTPFPFQELTIPYLRNRLYDGRIEDKVKYFENSGYTSYIASYSSDGLKVNGLLTEPKGDMPAEGWPAIIFIHGYIVPENYRTTVNYNSYVDYLAKNGFVVYKIDLRGHGESEGEAGGGYYSGDYIIDTLNAYNALLNTENVNNKAIGLWGHSMAGNIVLRSLAAKPDIPAVVIWAGAGYTYTDLLEYMISDNSYRPPPKNTERARKRQELRNAYGTFEPGHWFWKQVPATNYLEGIRGAIQLNHAIDDNVVSIQYSRNLNNLLNKTPITHELNEYPSGGHNLAGSTFNQAMQNTVEFFKKYLK